MLDENEELVGAGDVEEHHTHFVLVPGDRNAVGPSQPSNRVADLQAGDIISLNAGGGDRMEVVVARVHRRLRSEHAEGGSAQSSTRERPATQLMRTE